MELQCLTASSHCALISFLFLMIFDCGEGYKETNSSEAGAEQLKIAFLIDNFFILKYIC